MQQAQQSGNFAEYGEALQRLDDAMNKYQRAPSSAYLGSSGALSLARAAAGGLTRRCDRVDIGPPKQRAVLAVLLLAQGRVVSVDRLIDAVWGDDVPGSATASLQAYISNLRRALRDGADGGADGIADRAPAAGLLPRRRPDDVDLRPSPRGCAGRRRRSRPGDWDDALAAADAALALWRGPFLEDLRGRGRGSRRTRRGVDELRTECLDNRITALLALGRVPPALAEAARLRAADPLSDRGCWLQMLALYRAGRAAGGAGGLHAACPRARRRARAGAGRRAARPADGDPASGARAGGVAPPAGVDGRRRGGHAASTVPAGAPAAGRSAARAPLVGRERELATVAERSRRVAAGATRWLVLSGPPGIGKTRLAEEVAARVAAAGGDVVWVSCPDERATPPWWPMRQLVRALGADADEVLEVPPHADPDTARFLVYERIQTLLESAPALLAVVVDDVQWADSTSASCLAYIAGALRDHPRRDDRDGARRRAHPRGRHGCWARSPAANATGTSRCPRCRRVTSPRWRTQVADEVGHRRPRPRRWPTGPAATRSSSPSTPGCPGPSGRATRFRVAVRSVLDRRLAGAGPRGAAGAADRGGDRRRHRLRPSGAGAGRPGWTSTRSPTTSTRRPTSGSWSPRTAGDGYAFAHGLLREQLLASMPALRRQRLHAKVADVLADSRRRRRADAARAASGRGAAAGRTGRGGRRPAGWPPRRPPQRWSSDIAAEWWQAALDAYDRLPASARDDGERDALTVSMLEAHSRAGRGRLVLGHASSATWSRRCAPGAPPPRDGWPARCCGPAAAGRGWRRVTTPASCWRCWSALPRSPPTTRGAGARVLAALGGRALLSPGSVGGRRTSGPGASSWRSRPVIPT